MTKTFSAERMIKLNREKQFLKNEKIHFNWGEVKLSIVFYQTTSFAFWRLHHRKISRVIQILIIQLFSWTKESDRQCMAVQLSMWYCAQIFQDLFEPYKTFNYWVCAQSRLSKSSIWVDTFWELFFLKLIK